MITPISLSVVVAAYNAARTLPDTIASVRRQAFGCEIVVVDDGSTDDTVEVLRALAPDPTTPIRWVSQDNQGQGPATNAGIDLATGDWVMLLDADDRIFGRAFEAYADDIARHGETDLLVAGFREHQPNGRVRDCPAPPFSADRLANFELYIDHRPRPITPGAAIVRRPVLDRIRVPPIRMGQTFVFYAQIFATHDARSFPEPVAHYHADPDRAVQRALRYPDAWQSILDTLFDPDILPPEMMALRSRQELRTLLSQFRTFHLAGLDAEAARYYRLALARSPRQALRWTYLRKALRGRLRRLVRRGGDPALPQTG